MTDGVWEWVKMIIAGGGGYGVSQIVDTWFRGRKEKKEAESDNKRIANESRDRDLQLIRNQDETERLFREELRSEMTVMRGRISSLEQELKMANERYYEVLEENAKIKAQYEFAMREIEMLRTELHKAKN